MEELENIAQQAFYLLVGGTVLVAENASKFIEELPEQIENITAEAIARGEATCQTGNEESAEDWNWDTSGSNNSEVSPELRRKLFALVNGDLALAERLLNQIKQKYPNCAESCYYEKVIYDLERDR